MVVQKVHVKTRDTIFCLQIRKIFQHYNTIKYLQCWSKRLSQIAEVICK